jgi:hypothetical protein
MTPMLLRRVLSSSSRSAVTSRYCSNADSSVRVSISGGQGLLRNWNILPSFTAEIAALRSASPVSITRTVSGVVCRTRVRNSIPSIPGIRRSETITAKGPSSAIAATQVLVQGPFEFQMSCETTARIPARSWHRHLHTGFASACGPPRECLVVHLFPSRQLVNQPHCGKTFQIDILLWLFT